MLTATREAPLTDAQELLCELDRATGGQVFHPRFITRTVYEVNGPVDADVLHAALGDVVARHGALRTVVVRDGLRAHQRVLPPMPARLAVSTLDSVVLAEEFAASVCRRDHPCDEPPLLWAYLGRYGADRALLVLVAHHTAADAWSQWLVARDLRAAYTARVRGTAPLDADVLQYADISAQERGGTALSRLRRTVPYWRERLAGIDPPGPRAARPVPGGPLGDRADLRFPIGEHAWNAVTAAARRARTTPFTLLLTALTAALFAGGDAAEAFVPVVTAGRLPAQWRTVGFLLNVLPIRVDLSGVMRSDEADLSELQRRVDRTCRLAYANDIPVRHALPEILAVLSRPGRVPPVFRLISYPPIAESTPDSALPLRLILEDYQPPLAVPTPLLWTVRVDGPPAGYVSYDPLLFSASWVDRRVTGFRRVLGELGAPP
ncbi:MAG TPA: condensation domain-containing protein [Micromonosporaceae bacterium]|nr:condensation domain-containing protein [Micromonosporaceae bacterium]